MIDTCQTVIVLPVAPFASVEIVVPDDSFPVQVSTADSAEVIATGPTGSAEVAFPTPLASEVLVLVAKGDPGEDGEDGDDGEDGEDGRSAYQVAVDNGFVGDEAAWLASLKGDPGEPGEPGDDGEDGQDGEDGAGLTAVHVTAAEYAALTVEQQNDPSKWWVIPKL